MTHSPLPWRQDGNTIVDANGTEVVDYVHESADLSFIVTAVNAYSVLVAALEVAEFEVYSKDACEKVEAALHLVRKGSAT